MAHLVRYLSHPQVQIDPQKDVECWSLNAIGRARVEALAKTRALKGTSRVISSAEIKAIETAKPLADALGLEMEIRSATHENDRRATGFLPPAEFETVADAFFANPGESTRGWETAAHAQDRIVGEVRDIVDVGGDGDILIVGHGGVGTLLYCALAGVPISWHYDQGPGGGGCYFSFSTHDMAPHSRWRPMEDLIGL